MKLSSYREISIHNRFPKLLINIRNILCMIHKSHPSSWAAEIRCNSCSIPCIVTWCIREDTCRIIVWVCRSGRAEDYRCTLRVKQSGCISVISRICIYCFRDVALFDFSTKSESSRRGGVERTQRPKCKLHPHLQDSPLSQYP